MEKCPFHDETMQIFREELKKGSEEFRQTREKLDRILDGQSQQAIKIQELHSTIHNGLKTDTSKTALCVSNLEVKLTQVCEKYDVKFKEFDEFRWFRSWANTMKDGAIRKVLSAAFVGGMLISIVFFLLYGSTKLAQWIKV